MDEQYVFAGSYSGTIIIWDIEAQRGILLSLFF